MDKISKERVLILYKIQFQHFVGKTKENDEKVIQDRPRIEPENFQIHVISLQFGPASSVTQDLELPSFIVRLCNIEMRKHI
jgi:hypothetical protein